jgi:quinoprotein glucose dehydrogenase
MTREEISKRTPEVERYCTEQFDKLQGRTLYTPYGTKTTLVFPGAMGGGNWGGVSFDPKLGYVFVNTTNMGAIGHLVPAAEGSAMGYRNESGYARFLDQDRYPCQQPPWGELSAVNANTGDIVWRTPLGNFEELEGQGLKNTGTPNVGGTIVTAGGLLFVGATNDSRFRAFDSRTGKELWSARLEATANATPITYQGRSGKQYVVIAAGGPAHLRNVGDTSKNSSDTLVAFALSEHVPITSDAKPVQASPAPSPAAVAGRAGVLPDVAGNGLVVRICTKCHGLDTFVSYRMSAEEWQNEVQDMVARGAQGTGEEIRAVTDFLIKNLGKRAGAQN